ncbi:hypothetical protein DUNSADRAFT_16651 [Dunaliella salina]|uniref:Uncharacterized protein n=1 Tax=Dunaliella salina TaxID=3046 RepID=A0ABQ7G362_DUNSA|nr:hypothetical protein DUNSADRAFT_16651 [Dunaliella salina]|eukprot:KAF5829032.1 hypothetical protein DUNSADRAFT_16651 [Dunaliella salina]
MLRLYSQTVLLGPKTDQCSLSRGQLLKRCLAISAFMLRLYSQTVLLGPKTDQCSLSRGQLLAHCFHTSIIITLCCV